MSSSKLEALNTNAALLASAEAAVELPNAEAMKRPKMFSLPSIQAGLAVAMTTPLYIIVKSSLSKTIVACLGGQERKKRVRLIFMQDIASAVDLDHPNTQIQKVGN